MPKLVPGSPEWRVKAKSEIEEIVAKMLEAYTEAEDEFAAKPKMFEKGEGILWPVD
jgi:hypothetical protein